MEPMSICGTALNEDSVIDDPASGFSPLEDYEVALLQAFATLPLRFTTRPIDLPGQAAPLGYRLLSPGPVLLRPFTPGELVARYRTHRGYVAHVKRAVAALVARRLYDRVIGTRDVATAARSRVLR